MNKANTLAITWIVALLAFPVAALYGYISEAYRMETEPVSGAFAHKVWQMGEAIRRRNEEPDVVVLAVEREPVA